MIMIFVGLGIAAMISLAVGYLLISCRFLSFRQFLIMTFFEFFDDLLIEFVTFKRLPYCYQVRMLLLVLVKVLVMVYEVMAIATRLNQAEKPVILADGGVERQMAIAVLHFHRGSPRILYPTASVGQWV